VRTEATASPLPSELQRLAAGVLASADVSVRGESPLQRVPVDAVPAFAESFGNAAQTQAPAVVPALQERVEPTEASPVVPMPREHAVASERGPRVDAAAPDERAPFVLEPAVFPDPSPAAASIVPAVAARTPVPVVAAVPPADREPTVEPTVEPLAEPMVEPPTRSRVQVAGVVEQPTRTVRIAIDRIEIAAARPAPEPSPRRRPAPSMTLDRYEDTRR
jgi:hypothetical protein